jgi:arylsulfatase A-like enzyme
MFGEHLSAWLERYHDRNFFLYLHVRDPHGEYDPPEPFDRWYLEEGPGTTPVEFESDLDAEWLDPPTAESRKLLYDGEIRHNDSLLPGFLEMLAQFDLRRDTLLVLTADHGEFFGEHGLWEHRPPGYRQVIHVPLQLLYPPRFDSARRIPQSVQLIDVMPTILELAEVDTGALVMHGESLVDLAEGRRNDYWNERVVMSEEPMAMKKGEPYVCGSLFFRNWHFISSKKIGNSRIPTPLRTRVYDFRNAPEETRASYRFMPDVITTWQYWRVVKELQENNVAAWKSWTGGEADTLTVDPDVREHLEALGYIQ